MVYNHLKNKNIHIYHKVINKKLDLTVDHTQVIFNKTSCNKTFKLLHDLRELPVTMFKSRQAVNFTDVDVPAERVQTLKTEELKLSGVCDRCKKEIPIP